MIIEVSRKLKDLIRTVLQKLKLDKKWMLHTRLIMFQYD